LYLLEGQYCEGFPLPLNINTNMQVRFSRGFGAFMKDMLMQALEVSKRRFSGTRAGHYASRAQDNSSIYQNTVAISE